MGKKTIVLSLFIISFASSVLGQNYLDFVEYFTHQKDHFQQTLDRIGCNQCLQTDELLVYDDVVVLNIQLKTSQDSAVAVWKMLKNTFQKTNSIEMEQWLFIKAAYIFDLPYKDLRLRVFNDSEDGDSNVDGRILFKEGEIVTEGFPLRTKVKEVIELDSFDMAPFFTPISTEIPLKQKKKQIYRHIQAQAISYFDSLPGDSEVSSPIAAPLVIEVKNVKGEVVPMNSTWFSLPNPYEKLHFTITLNIDEKNKTLSCNVELDGKYGSGLWFFKPRVAANYIEMKPKYLKDLERYIKMKFQPRLHTWLTNEIGK